MQFRTVTFALLASLAATAIATPIPVHQNGRSLMGVSVVRTYPLSCRLVPHVYQ
jgi:hypothetical protein